jgi:O-antigen/teichoic acid export membrane protein
MRRLFRTTSVGVNTITNFLGKVWGALLGILFTPLYLKFLGIESYALIGLYVSILGFISFLDMGLSTTLNRELARGASSGAPASETRNLIRTYETIYWIVGIFVGASLLALSPWIAEKWIRSPGVPLHSIRNAIAIIGLLIAIQWPSSLYIGGLMGSQRQVLLNVIQAIAAILQSGGAVLVLWLIAPTIEAYFLWQIIIVLFLTISLRICLLVSLPSSCSKPVFKMDFLLSHWKFSAGMTAITILASVLTQGDKVILSRILPLKSFGYYILAFNAANALGYIVYPFFSSLFPRFSQLAAEVDTKGISVLYHTGSQFVSAVLLPVAMALCFFPKEILSFWLRDPETVANTYRILSLLACGTAINSLMILPLCLQLSHGWTRLSLLKNIIASCVFIPALFVLAIRWGAIGAAFVWISLNLGYLIFEIPLMHRRLLKGETVQWYLVDVGLPLAISFVVFILAKFLLPAEIRPLFAFFWIIGTTLTALFLAFIAMPNTRNWILDRLTNVPKLSAL